MEACQIWYAETRRRGEAGINSEGGKARSKRRKGLVLPRFRLRVFPVHLLETDARPPAAAQALKVLIKLGYVPHITARGEEAAAKKASPRYRARRWVVERSHSWLNRFRRILIRWEKLVNRYQAFLHFACAIIVWRAAGVFG